MDLTVFFFYVYGQLDIWPINAKFLGMTPFAYGVWKVQLTTKSAGTEKKIKKIVENL